ncbi:MAG TPA: ParB/RepB/Spo0J family partition protein [Firmicutes bacterium]|nr:ParB/RepB/Spo0J family partition protein [Bacillota bacterium]
MTLVQVPIDQIEVAADHLRSTLDQQKLVDLINSVAEVGLLHPILVIETEEGYRLIAGYRRLMACKELGFDTITAFVLSKDASLRQIQIVENIQREDLNPIDRAMAVQLFIQENKLSVLQASKQLGIPRTTINDWLTVLDLPQQYQNAVLNNYYGGSSPLTLSHVGLAKRFANKIGSEKMLNVVLDAVLYYNLSRAETRTILKLVAGAKDLSIDQAVRKVRLMPQERDRKDGSPAWSVEQLMASLTKSGDYLVKTDFESLQTLSDKQKQEVIRRARALKLLLDDVIEKISQHSPFTKSG